MSERFEQLDQARQADGKSGVVRTLLLELRRRKKPRELFEALKMQARMDAGLSPIASPDEPPVAPAVRDKLEQGMFVACREVGMMLLDQGRIREGWMYLQPVGDTPAVARRLARIEPNQDNMDELIEVSLYEGVDVARGFQMVLDHYGVCNSITAFESSVLQRSGREQAEAAELLVKRLHADLLENVQADIAQRDDTFQVIPPGAGGMLAPLFGGRGWLFSDTSYHIDTTHLASTVRFARVLSAGPTLRLALDLTEYGRRLHEQFRYPGDPPFEDQYVAHGHFFRALLGEGVDAAVAYFEQRVRATDPRHEGRAPLEILADLLARIGRPEQAIALLDELGVEEAGPPIGLCPSMLELHLQANRLDQWLTRCKSEDDVLGYASGLVGAK